MKNWDPTRKQKKMAEKFLWPLVQSFQFMTSWKMAWSWSFLLAYSLGQPIVFCVLVSIFATVAGWYFWKE